MNIKEANKLIAKYRNYEIADDGDIFYLNRRWENEPFTSLDALVPVWEKMKMSHYVGSTEIYTQEGGYFDFSIHTGGIKNEMYTSTSTTIQEAAAIATAKAILELKNAK